MTSNNSKHEKKITNDSLKNNSTLINIEIMREVNADEINFSKIPHGKRVKFWNGVAARVNKIIKRNKWKTESEEELNEKSTETRFMRYYSKMKAELNEEIISSGQEITKDEEDLQTIVENLRQKENQEEEEDEKSKPKAIEKVKRQRDAAAKNDFETDLESASTSASSSGTPSINKRQKGGQKSKSLAEIVLEGNKKEEEMEKQKIDLEKKRIDLEQKKMDLDSKERLARLEADMRAQEMQLKKDQMTIQLLDMFSSLLDKVKTNNETNNL